MRRQSMFIRITLLVMMVMGAVNLTTPTAQAKPTAHPNGQRHRIMSAHSSKVLDVPWGSTADGARIEQHTWHGGNNQLWYMESQGDGYFIIRAAHSLKCLDVPYASTQDGVQIEQHTCNYRDNQRWRLIHPNGSLGCTSYCLIQAKHSGKVLDVAWGSTADGARIIQCIRNGGTNQIWYIDHF